jgi:hypothetical protein
MDFEAAPRDGVVWVSLPRTVDEPWLQGVLDSMPGIFSLCADSGSAGVLFDVRGVELELRWQHLLRVVFEFRSACPRGVGIAAVVEPRQRMRRRDFQALAGLAGLLLGVFTDEAPAVAWLKETKAFRPRAGRSETSVSES